MADFEAMPSRQISGLWSAKIFFQVNLSPPYYFKTNSGILATT